MPILCSSERAQHGSTPRRVQGRCSPVVPRTRTVALRKVVQSTSGNLRLEHNLVRTHIIFYLSSHGGLKKYPTIGLTTDPWRLILVEFGNDQNIILCKLTLYHISIHKPNWISNNEANNGSMTIDLCWIWKLYPAYIHGLWISCEAYLYFLATNTLDITHCC